MNWLKKIGLQRPPARSGQEPRLLAYCASNVGLGHYGRVMRVLGRVRELCPNVSILLATDAPPTPLEDEHGVAVLRLPGFRFTDEQNFKEAPRHLEGLNAQDLRGLRAQLLASLAGTFQPNAVLMDTSPHGKRDEMLELLRRLHKTHAARVLLMMRDIPCPPGERFKLNGPREQILKHARLYDRLLVSGDPAYFDVAAEYDWPPSVRRRLQYVGFVVPTPGPQAVARALEPHPQLDVDRPLIAVSFGGGWRAQDQAQYLIGALDQCRRRGHVSPQMVMSVGMTIEQDKLELLREEAAGIGGGVVIERFLPDFPALLARASLAILQAGSTAFQLLEGDTPILLTARDYKSREQQERAKRLALWPGVQLLEGLEDVEVLAAQLSGALESRHPLRRTGYRYDGVEQAARAVAESL